MAFRSCLASLVLMAWCHSRTRIRTRNYMVSCRYIYIYICSYTCNQLFSRTVLALCCPWFHWGVLNSDRETMCKNMCNHMFDKRTLLSVFSPVPCRFGGMFLQRPNRTALRTGSFFDSLFLLVEVVRTCPYWSSTLTVHSERGVLVSVHTQSTGPYLVPEPARLSQRGGRLSRAFRTGAAAMQHANR